MLKEWLEPMIKQRLEQVGVEVDEDDEFGRVYAHCMRNFAALKPVITEEVQPYYFELETLIGLVEIVSSEISYRKGLQDGMDLQLDINSLVKGGSHAKQI